MTVRCQCVAIVVVVVLGAVLIIIGGGLIAYFKRKSSEDVKKFLLPSSGSESFEAWRNWSHFNPVYRHFYFFEVLNPDEIVKTGKNITVNETGPFVYRVNFERRDVSFTPNGTLSYKLYKSYSFERNMSVGDESQLVTIVNLPILNLATRLRVMNHTVTSMVAKEIRRLNESLFSEVNVSDALWGYENTNLRTIFNFLEDYFSIQVINDTFYGLMYQSGKPQRTEYMGAFETSSGVNDIKTLWNIKEWNGMSSLNVWNNASCNSINGTDGYSWPPGLGTSDVSVSYIFDSEWCRSIALDSKGKEWSGRLKTIRYAYAKNVFSYNGINSGFCEMTPKKHVKCLGTGVLNVTKCKDNAPLLLSEPHFLDAAKAYTMPIKGINPDRNQHSSTVNIEPVTGEVVEASRKMQLNAYVMHLPSFPSTARFLKNHTVFPVVWMKEVYSMTDKERDSIYDSIIGPGIAYEVIQFVLIGLGILLLLCALIGFLVIFFRRSKDPERQPLLHH